MVRCRFWQKRRKLGRFIDDCGGRAMRLIAVLAFALVVSNTSCNAASLPVMGGFDCGKWVEARTIGNSSNAEEFVQGTINGLVFGTGFDFWQARGISVSRESAMLWMDNYCHQNPLSNVTSGAIELFEQNAGWNPKSRPSRSHM